MRLLASSLSAGELASRRTRLMDTLGDAIPRGMGPGSLWQLTDARQLVEILLLTEATSRAFHRATGSGHDLRLLCDVSHNLAKIEAHEVNGGSRRLCVHRKGATRALPPGHPDLPGRYAAAGQPVLVPGSMGTGSYILSGVSSGSAFFSACHGAGRKLSRNEASRATRGRIVRAELAAAGIAVRAASVRGLAEEAPAAYKDVDEVVAVCERAAASRSKPVSG